VLKTPPRGLRDFLAFLLDRLHCLNPSRAVLSLEQFSFCAKYGVVKQRIISNASRLELLTHFGDFQEVDCIYNHVDHCYCCDMPIVMRWKHLCMPLDSNLITASDRPFACKQWIDVEPTKDLMDQFQKNVKVT